MASRRSKQPTNPNLLRINSYELQFTKIPELKFQIQSVNLPDISMEYTNQPSPFQDIHLEGSSVTYGPLTFTFLVTENLSNWLAIHNWIRSLANVKNFTEYETDRLVRETDATLTILTNKNNPIMRVFFKDCMPKSLGGLEFSSSGAASTNLSSTLTLVYQSYTIEQVE